MNEHPAYARAWVLHHLDTIHLQDDIIDGGPSYIYDEILIDNRSHALEPIGFWRTINILLTIIIVIIGSEKSTRFYEYVDETLHESISRYSPFHGTIPARLLSFFLFIPSVLSLIRTVRRIPSRYTYCKLHRFVSRYVGAKIERCYGTNAAVNR